MKNKIIIVEGPQGVGKTTTVDYLRETIPHTNLFRLTGSNDSSKRGLRKSVKFYENLLKFMKSMENTGMNLLFDRTFFTEEVYCRLGYKEYNFTKEYKRLLNKLSKLNFDTYYINLSLFDINNYKQRLVRDGKANVTYAKFDVSSSEKQQDTYLDLFAEISTEYWATIKPRTFFTDTTTREKLYSDIMGSIDWEY